LSQSIHTAETPLFFQCPQIGRVIEHELALPERMAQPTAFEPMDVHAETNLLGGDFLQHPPRSPWRRSYEGSGTMNPVMAEVRAVTAVNDPDGQKG
jgi:hypothetical protein